MPSIENVTKTAVGYWVRDYDMRDIHFKQIEFDDTVVYYPTAGMRLWIYCAELPWDPRDGPRRGRDPEGWCASRVCPDGEYGILGTDDPSYTPITREQFIHAADNGWPDWKEADG